MKKFKIAQAQMPVITDRKACLDYLESAASRCRAAGADLLALPEMFSCPYSTAAFPQYAQPQGGSLWSACSAIAKKYQIWFSPGTMPEIDEKGNIFNTAYIFDRNGNQTAKHRKMHLFDIDVEGGQHFRESDILSAGNSITTFDTEFGTFGLAICYDIRFFELFRLMALKDARFILVPAAFNMTTGPMHWELLFRSQAVGNQVFIAGTAPARNPEADYVSWGHSLIADPWGNVISRMDEKEAMQITEIDLEETDRVREQIPVLKHRRTDVYQLKEFLEQEGLI